MQRHFSGEMYEKEINIRIQCSQVIPGGYQWQNLPDNAGDPRDMGV